MKPSLRQDNTARRTAAVPTGSHLRACFLLAASALVMCSSGFRAEPPQGLVAEWTFDAAQGQLVLDSGPNAHHATVRAGTLVPGVRGAAIRCDGEATTISVPSVTGLTPREAMTIEAWIQPRELPPAEYPSIVRKENSFALRFSHQRLGFLLWLDGQVRSVAAENTDWSPDHWYHVAATYDGQQMQIYVNGQPATTRPHTASGAVDLSGTPLGIGCSASQHLFHGKIDEVRLYDHALSADAIADRYRAGVAGLQNPADADFPPRPIGGGVFEFRKPPRDIRPVVPGFLWIDAEDFSDYGGWTLDTQFVHLMGSAYLIATGMGQPVKDATVDVAVPHRGTWRLWVRAKNWLPEFSPGRFAVRVGDRLSHIDFGVAETGGWRWQSGGEFELEAGPTQLSLHDLTGSYGRCDALVLTTDLDYRPPHGVESIRRERSRLTGVPLRPESRGDFDVIIVGAGAAGGCAALAAARLGAKTALIQNRPVLGGNASIELGVGICGASVSHPNARESGIIEELGRIRARYGFPKLSEPLRIACEREPHLTVFLNEHVDGVQMADAHHIGGVRSTNTLTGAVSTYGGRLFLDCTGDGWVGYFAGADYRIGREARTEFQEDLAPKIADQITMSGCLMGQRSVGFRAVSTGHPVAYEPPPWAAKLPPAEHFGRTLRSVTNGNWWLEHPGTIDDLWDAERARDELIRISFGYWDFVKNHWEGREQAANHKLAYVPITDAKRESRRLVGDYILTQNDVQSARVFPDRISYGGWSLDVHHPLGIFSGDEGPFDFDPRVPIYTIPYRCLYSRNIENLLFAGRNVSVTHVALGTVRVQGTLATLGQAAGTAAAICIDRGLTPRELGQNHIRDLQQTLLKHDQYIPELCNEDPADLARDTKVHATSTATCEEFTRRDVELDDELHPLNMPRAVMVPRGVRSELRSVSLRLASNSPDPQPVTLHVREAGTSGDFSSKEDLTTVTVPVPPGESYVTFPLDIRVDSAFVWFWLSPNEHISWRLMKTGPRGSLRAYGGGATRAWTLIRAQQYAIITDPPLGIAGDYSPANIHNGISRIVGHATNMWASDPEQPLPQSIELEFRKPSTFNTVYLTFDTDLNNRYHDAPLPKQCVRDYELSYCDSDQWITLIQETGNFQRHRVHRFPDVSGSKLRLTVTATNGATSARVFEVRVYREPAVHGYEHQN